MEPKLHYATVSEAIDQLRSDGYVIDFSLSGNQLTSGEEKFDVEDFEIAEV
jgi:biotin operon repressor